MFNILELTGQLSNAVVLSIDIGRHGYSSISMSFPTNDIDVRCSLCNTGTGHILRWEGMEMIDEEIHFTKEEFRVIYNEVLKELTKRLENI